MCVCVCKVRHAASAGAPTDMSTHALTICVVSAHVPTVMSVRALTVSVFEYMCTDYVMSAHALTVVSARALGGYI